MEHYHLIVIGGGPAGFFAALSAAEANPHLRILILEKSNKLLSKVGISGGGRCNVTHACFTPADLVEYYPRGKKELLGPFTRFQPQDTIAWFKKRGVKLKTETDGRMFPTTDSSETIINCLMQETRKRKVVIYTKEKVTDISPGEKTFNLTLASTSKLTADKILIAAGGGSKSAYTIAQNLGHTIVPPVPSLFTFNIRDPRIQGLSGISLPNVELEIPSPRKKKRNAKLKTTGPLLITHWGISGPAALKLSAWGARYFAENHYQSPLKINWLYPHTQEDIFTLLKETKANSPRQHIAKHAPQDLIPSRLWEHLVHAAGISSEQTWAEISNQALQKLAQESTQGEYQIQGKGVFKSEFVTCGGVSLKEINFQTMESRICPNLYFAGEVLDIDGLTGGFNFQAAWTTAWLAGQAIAADL